MSWRRRRETCTLCSCLSSLPSLVVSRGIPQDGWSGEVAGGRWEVAGGRWEVEGGRWEKEGQEVGGQEVGGGRWKVRKWKVGEWRWKVRRRGGM